MVASDVEMVGEGCFVVNNNNLIVYVVFTLKCFPLFVEMDL